MPELPPLERLQVGHGPNEESPPGPAVDLLERALGQRPSPEMVWRWRTRGIRLPDGSTAKLACRRCGRKWFTTEAAVKDLIDLQTRAHTRDRNCDELLDLENRLRDAGLI